MKYVKYIFLSIQLIIFISGCATFRQPDEIFRDRIDSLFISDFFNATQAAVSVYDLTENKSLLKHNDKLLFHPASNTKILTSASAYLFLGENYKFKTQVFYTGEIQDSVCQGDIYFTGGFDPDFSVIDLDSVTAQIKKFGIKKIEGNVYADVSAMDSLDWGEGWMWDDDPEPFAAHFSPLSINKNKVKVIFEPGEINQPVKITIEPNTSLFSVKNNSSTIDSGKSTFVINRDWLNRTNTIIAHGNILKSAKRDSIYVNVVNPTLYFLNLTKKSFEANGISLAGKLDTLTLKTNANKIFSFERNIDDVIYKMNKISDNLSAELTLRAIALNNIGKPATSKKGIIFFDSLITTVGLNPKNYRLVDGSGVSTYNLVSSELLLTILKYFYYKQPKLYSKLYESFPISGVDGTLSNRMKNNTAYKQVHAKTGTIRGVSSLSGYLFTRNNHLLAFSILIENYLGSSSSAKAIEDQLCRIIFESY